MILLDTGEERWIFSYVLRHLLRRRVLHLRFLLRLSHLLVRLRLRVLLTLPYLHRRLRLLFRPTRRLRFFVFVVLFVLFYSRKSHRRVPSLYKLMSLFYNNQNHNRNHSRNSHRQVLSLYIYIYIYTTRNEKTVVRCEDLSYECEPPIV